MEGHGDVTNLFWGFGLTLDQVYDLFPKGHVPGTEWLPAWIVLPFGAVFCYVAWFMTDEA